MGYGLEFWWLVMVNVTSRWQATEFLSHIPLKHEVFFASCLFASLNPQKFDYVLRTPLRMTGWWFVLQYAFVLGSSGTPGKVVPYNKTLAILSKSCYNKAKKGGESIGQHNHIRIHTFKNHRGFSSFWI